MRTTRPDRWTHSKRRVNLIGTFVLLASVLVALPQEAGAAPFTLSGDVTNESMEPLPGIAVRSYTSNDLQTLEAETTTDALGNYTFTSLENGDSHFLQLTDPTGAYAYTVSTVWPSGDPTIRDFVLAIGGSITGRIVDTSGSGVGGLDVRSTRGPSTVSDSDGNYTLTGIREGLQSLRVSDPQEWYLATTGWEGQIVEPAAGENLINVDLDVILGSKVSGTVTDMSGSPIWLANVSGVSWLSYTVTGSSGFVFRTDEEGTYSGTVLPGAYGIVGTNFGYQDTEGVYGGGPVPRDRDWSDSQIFAAIPGVELTGIDIALDVVPVDPPDPTGRITGILTDEETGAGIDNYVVVLQRYPPAVGGSPQQNWPTILNTAGGGVFDGDIPAGSYRVRYGRHENSGDALTNAALWWPGVATSPEAITVDIAAGQSIDLSMALPTGSLLYGSVSTEFGLAEQTLVRVFDQAGVELVADVADRSWSGGIESTDYALRLVPGTYDLVFEKQGYGTYRADDVVMSGSDMRLDVVLPSKGKITGTVTFPGGTPGAWLTVYALDLNGSVVREADTGADGTYSLTLADSDMVTIRVRDWPNGSVDPGDFWGPTYYGGVGLLSAATTVSVAPDGLLQGIDIEMQAAPFLSGSVTGSDGSPLPASIHLLDPETGTDSIWLGVTDQNGAFAFPVVPQTLTVRAHYYAPGPATQDPWMAQWSRDAYRVEDATPIDIDLQDSVTTNFVLEAASSVSGSIADGAGDIVAGAVVVVRGADGVFVGATISDQYGDYSWPILTPGDYTLEFRRDGFPTEWWDDAESLAGSTSITVGTAETITGVDVVLGPYMPPPPPDFVDDGSSIFEPDIEWMAAAGITKGCNPPTNDRFCPDDIVTRGQMAAFLVRALNLTDDGGGNKFVDDDASIFETDIAKMAAAGITKGCNPPTNDRFCPDDIVTRGQMAAFLHRALG